MLRQIRLHRKMGARKVESVLVILRHDEERCYLAPAIGQINATWRLPVAAAVSAEREQQQYVRRLDGLVRWRACRCIGESRCEDANHHRPSLLADHQK